MVVNGVEVNRLESIVTNNLPITATINSVVNGEIRSDTDYGHSALSTINRDVVAGQMRQQWGGGGIKYRPTTT